jgi:Spy/CpxP family protein refolding chaperone
MKRITIWSTLAVALVVMAVVVLRAEARGGAGWCNHSWRHFGPAGYLAHGLKLDRVQKEKIQTLWEAERPTASADIHDLLAENKEMNAMAVQGNPDQSKVHEIAGREAATIAKLVVEKARLQSAIYLTVLNPEQRAKSVELQKKWESRLDRAAAHFGTPPTE